MRKKNVKIFFVLVEPHDLVRYGLIPELIGRIPVVTVLDPLDEDALVRVLKEPKNSLVNNMKRCSNWIIQNW